MKKVTFFPIIICLAVSVFFIASCKKSDSDPAVAPTLYDSLGGTAKVVDPVNSSVMIEKGRLGIRSVIDSTIFVIAGDSRINGHFSVSCYVSEVISQFI